MSEETKPMKPKSSRGHGQSQRIDVASNVDSEEAIAALRKWLGANKVPVQADASPADTVKAAADTLLRTSKVMKTLKKSEDDLKSLIEEQNERLAMRVSTEEYVGKIEELERRLHASEQQLRDAGETQAGRQQMYESEVQSLRSEIESLRGQGACAEPAVSSEVDSSTLREEYELLRDEYDKLVRSVVSRAKLDEKEREIGKLQDDVGALEEELQSARACAHQAG
jgi:hypothetical protein